MDDPGGRTLGLRLHFWQIGLLKSPALMQIQTPHPAGGVQDLLAKLRSEAVWLKRFSALPREQRSLPLLRNQLVESGLRLRKLQTELFQSGVSPDNTMIPTLERVIELMREGMDEKGARAQAEIDLLIDLYKE